MLSRRGFLTLSGAAGAAAVAAVAGYRLLPGGTVRGAEPLIRYGAERCARCGMIISDARFAAAWRVPSGGEQHFDDIGCLVMQAREHRPPAATRFWTHDYESEAWLIAEEGVYFVSPAVNSPMGYGVAAATTRAGAERLAARLKDARLVAWDALATTLERKV